MCGFRWCGRQLCLRNMPISGVNATPRPTAVYASDPALPRRPQDLLPSCLLGFERTRLSLASSFQLPLAPRIRLPPRVVTARRTATCRMRANPGSRGPGPVPGARGSGSFPLAPALGSTNSAAGCPTLFAGFIATTAGPDFSRPFIMRFGSQAFRMRTRTANGLWSGVRSPRFRRDPFVRDVALDPGRATAPRIPAPHMWPSTNNTGSAPATFRISWLNPTPHTIAVYASPLPSPTDAQHSLAGGRYPLPAPDFHRLDLASFAWRTLLPPVIATRQSRGSPAYGRLHSPAAATYP